MKNSWLVWILIVGVVVTVFFAFNQQNDVPFNDIFPEDESGPVDIEYEFISKDHNKKLMQQSNAVVKEEAPAVVESISSVKAEKTEKVIEIEEVVATPPKEVIEVKKKFQRSIQKVFHSPFKLLLLKQEKELMLWYQS